MPLFSVEIDAELEVREEAKGRAADLAALDAWKQAVDDRGVRGPDERGVRRISEQRLVEAPSAEDAERMAAREFGADAFDAGLPSGPRSFSVNASFSLRRK